jgi:hypothetical protein
VARTRKFGLTALGAVTAIVLGLGGTAAAGDDDTTPPQITVTLSGTAGAAGWYVSDVAIRWRVTDPESGIDKRSGCERGKLSAETSGETLTCTARNKAGLTASQSVTIRIDKTAPTVSAAPDRTADANGWYNHALAVSFTATDGISGVAVCDPSVRYSGPDGTNLGVAGGCSNRAGHRAVAGFAFQYDGTPTGAVRKLDATATDHQVTLTWHRPVHADGLSGFLVTRTGPRKSRVVVYQGRNAAFVDKGVANGAKLRYQVHAVDQAGNRSPAKTAVITPSVQLLVAPRPGAEVKGPPLLRWAPYRSPRYYNVQLWRGGGKILSAWPARARLKLPRTWTFKGRRYTLGPGHYRWWVFPGYGSRSKAHYGPTLGSSTFVVMRR